MTQTIPVIEIAHHADPGSVRSPYRKQGPRDAVDQARMRAQNPVSMQMSTLVEEVQIIEAQLRTKIVRVIPTLLAALGIGPG